MMTDATRLRVLRRYETQYDQVWQSIEQGAAQTDNAFWLMGAANYIFRTNGILWAVDPMFRTPRSGVTLEKINPDALLTRTSFVLITHEHADHFDGRVMERYPEIGWIIPEHLRANVPPGCREKAYFIRPGEVVVRQGITIEAFSSPHFDAGSTVLGVKETGYLVDTGKQRILLPGDIRDYHESMPLFEGITHLFAHVWLGRGNARNLPCGDYPADFARFMLRFGAEKMYLAHLMEASRPLTDLWTYEHAGLVMDEMMNIDPAVQVSVPLLGRTNLL